MKRLFHSFTGLAIGALVYHVVSQVDPALRIAAWSGIGLIAAIMYHGTKDDL